MRLGIISDCTHYKTADGRIGTENHIFLRQINALASRFTETMICCPFVTISDSSNLSFYDNADIHFTGLPVVGGDRLKDKLKLFTAIPLWFKKYNQVHSFSDVVYQRFPNNLNIPGFFYFYFKKKKVFGTYTGTWKNYNGEPATYRFQKWLLKKYFRGPVWVYVSDGEMKARIHGGFSPSYSLQEWNEETERVDDKIKQIKEHGLNVFRLITVGTLIDYKNQLTILKAAEILRDRNFPFQLTIVGSGPMFNELKQFVVDKQLQDVVQLVGKKNYAELRALYRHHDFVVQAPLSEGFGKVPIEGFFHGLVPVLNNITLAHYMTGNDERGFLFDASNPLNLASKFEEIKNKLHLLPSMIEKGRAFAKSQTLEAWADEYYKTVMEYCEKA